MIKTKNLITKLIFPLLLIVLFCILFDFYNPFTASIMFTLPMQIIKYVSFIIILFYASKQDLQELNVNHSFYLSIFFIGLIGVTLDSFIGAVISCFLFFLVAMLTNLGGADVKIACACGFVLGVIPALFAFLIGLSVGVVIELIISLVKTKTIDIKRKFPLVPYITIGCFAVAIMKGFNIL